MKAGKHHTGECHTPLPRRECCLAARTGEWESGIFGSVPNRLLPYYLILTKSWGKMHSEWLLCEMGMIIIGISLDCWEEINEHLESTLRLLDERWWNQNAGNIKISWNNLYLLHTVLSSSKLFTNINELTKKILIKIVFTHKIILPKHI